MVKPINPRALAPLLFESDVVPDSGKTSDGRTSSMFSFESDVVPDSGKTYLYSA